MQFIELDPRSILPCPWNTNVVSHENEEKLRASIERHGMFKPIIVRVLEDGQHECVGGWHRCEQAIEIGYAKVPVCDLGAISDEKAREISLADNARYGLDDALKLNELLKDLDLDAVETTMPWTAQDIEAMTASIAVNVDDLDLDNVELPDEDEDGPEEAPEPKAPKTHQLLKFRCTLADAGKISELVSKTMVAEGFTASDSLTNAGDALAFILFSAESEDA